jgi:hypothetical protein
MSIGVDFTHPRCELFGGLQGAEITKDDALPLGTDCCDLIALWPDCRDCIRDHVANPMTAGSARFERAGRRCVLGPAVTVQRKSAVAVRSSECSARSPRGTAPTSRNAVYSLQPWSASGIPARVRSSVVRQRHSGRPHPASVARADAAPAASNRRWRVHTPALGVVREVGEQPAQFDGSRQLAMLLEYGEDRCGFYLGDDKHRPSKRTRTTSGTRRMIATSRHPRSKLAQFA